MMPRQEIESKVLEIYTNQMKEFHSNAANGDLENMTIPLEELSLEAVGINSVGFIRLVVAIENQFGFEFDDEMLNMELFQVIGDLISYIERKIKSDAQTFSS